tara:strand:- start:482 stop:1612 length:1131 start_codon:yes stop_codon:yes gene_type:complete
MVNSFNAGKFIDSYEYRYFSPAKINRDFELSDSDIQMSLSKADRLLGELKAFSKLVPDIDFFIHMHVLKEATESSKIEGTKTELDEALMSEDDVDPERRDDWREVVNYTEAMEYSLNKLKELPLSVRLLRETHKILLAGARGELKQPGEVRTSQNWIGGSNLSDAFFIPPHKDEVGELLSDLEKFWHNDDVKVPELISAAISHYQFETIHPFLDGNGRIGRLLITLYLIDKQVLTHPTLYLSDFFSKHKGSYYDSLTMVRQTSNLKQWILFFLNGVIHTSEKSIVTFQKIVEFRNKANNQILSFGQRSKKAQKVIEHMYGRPILDINQIAEILNSTHQTASSLVRKFVELGLLRELTGHKRNRIYVLQEYFKIFSN